MDGRKKGWVRRWLFHGVVVAWALWCTTTGAQPMPGGDIEGAAPVENTAPEEAPEGQPSSPGGAAVPKGVVGPGRGQEPVETQPRRAISEDSVSTVVSLRRRDAQTTEDRQSRRFKLDEPWVSPLAEWITKDNTLFSALFVEGPSTLEQLVTGARDIGFGLVVALFFLILTVLLRRRAADGINVKRLRLSFFFLWFYLFLAGLVVLARVYWPDLYRPLYIASLLILSYGVLQWALVGLFDVFLQGSRHVAVPVIVKNITSVVMYLVMVFIVLGRVGVDLTSILTTSAVLTAIIGFALQETLSSLIAGLAIQVEKPFAVGEFVRFEEHEGRITEINWRTTKIITRSLELVVIPNAVIARQKVINFSRYSPLSRRFVEVRLPYDLPPNRAKAALMSALNNVTSVVRDPAPQPQVWQYLDHSILYRLFFYIDDFGEREMIEDTVRTRIWYQLKREGITVPFPIRDVFMHKVSPDSAEKKANEDRMRRLRALLHVDFLDVLSDAEREQLASEAVMRRYGRGERIIEQGDTDSAFYILESGTVAVLVRGATGQAEREVAQLKQGAFFGEMSVMTGEARTASVVAVTDVEVIVVSKEPFQAIIASNETLVAALSKELAQRQVRLNAGVRVAGTEQTSLVFSEQQSIVNKIRTFFRLS